MRPPGFKLSKITKQRISEAHKGMKIPLSVRKKISKSKVLLNLKRERCKHWKGGRYKNYYGYILVYMPEHPNSDKRNGYIREHRIIYEKKIGRYLQRKEIVHHENNIKDDNRIENLKLFKNQSEHRNYHHRRKNV